MNSSSTASAEPELSVFFLIRSLNLGGAERQLLYLARGLKERGHKVTVAVYYPGVLDPELRAAGVELVDLGKRGRWDLAGFARRLLRAIRAADPQIVYSFLGTSNIVVAALKPLLRGIRIVWSVRASNMDVRAYDRVSALSYRVECALSGRADLVISNSRAGLDYAAAHGFPRERMIVVPNGVDTGRFAPDPGARERLRRSWGVGDGERVVGVLARLDPMKDHPTFLRAAAQVAKARPDVRFVCAGGGGEAYLEELRSLADRLGISGRLLFAGAVTEPVPVLNGFDICCSSSSWGEGFSNSVAEAMSCNLPCVVTDVGDSALVVGDTGAVVPPADPDALASALLRMLAAIEAGQPLHPRDRIVRNFSLEVLVEQTEQALKTVVAP